MKLHWYSVDEGGSFLVRGKERSILVAANGQIPLTMSSAEIAKLDACLLGCSHPESHLLRLQEEGFAGVLILSRKLWERSETPAVQIKLLDEKKEWRQNRLQIQAGFSDAAAGSLWFAVEMEEHRLFFSGSAVQLKSMIWGQEGDLAILDEHWEKKGFLNRNRFEQVLIIPQKRLICEGQMDRILTTEEKDLEL